MRSTLWLSFAACLVAVPAAAGPGFSFDGARGLHDNFVGTTVGARVDRLFAGADLGFRWPAGTAANGATNTLETQLLVGPWFEHGRWNWLAGATVGAIDRYKTYGIVNAKSVGWTAAAGVRTELGWRFARIDTSHGRTANFAIAIGARAYVTADREGVVLLSLGLLGWRAD